MLSHLISWARESGYALFEEGCTSPTAPWSPSAPRPRGAHRPRAPGGPEPHAL